jgi:hypothetical protein
MLSIPSPSNAAPTWSTLLFMSKKYLTIALVSVAGLPIIADWLFEFGLDYTAIMVPVMGGLLYVIARTATTYLLPSLIKRYPQKDQYVDSCLSGNHAFNPIREFFLISHLPVEELITYSSFVRHLYPLEQGLDISRDAALAMYSQVHYEYHDKLNASHRLFISITFLIAIFLLNFMTIERLVRLSKGLL